MSEAPQRGGWRRGSPPPWWPADEPWPPRVGRRHRMRRGFLWQAGCLAILILLTGAVGLIVLLWHLATAIGFSAGRRGGLAVLTVLALAALIGVAVGGRAVRRMAMPFGDLIDAAGRIEGGDYTVRVPERARRSAPGAGAGPLLQRHDLAPRGERAPAADAAGRHRPRAAHAAHRPPGRARGDARRRPSARCRAPGGGPRRDPRAGPARRRPAHAGAGRRRHAGAAPRSRPTWTSWSRRSPARCARAARPRDRPSSTDVADDLPLADVDPVRIREVLTNLVGNALRYAPPGSAVTISGPPRRRPPDAAAVRDGHGAGHPRRPAAARLRPLRQGRPTPEAPALAWPSPASWSRRTAATSAWRASPRPARASPSTCR